MVRKKGSWPLWILALALLAAVGCKKTGEEPGVPPAGRAEQPTGVPSAGKAEHPSEHPKEHPTEHPKEHPSGEQQSAVTKEDLAAAIEAYVKKEADLKGGFFLVYDGVVGEPLVLSLAKVHKERLSKVGEGVYFACADFKARTGKVYDLDVFMKGPNKDNLTVTEVAVHKEAGKERYTWFEEGGIWKKKPVGAAR